MGFGPYGAKSAIVRTPAGQEEGEIRHNIEVEQAGSPFYSVYSGWHWICKR